MSARNLTSGLQTALQQPHVPYFPLLKMVFDSQTLYLSGTDFDVDYDGQTWLAARGIGSIEKIVETGSSIEGMRFTLFGVSDESLAEVQQEKYQGREVTILWAFLDGATLHVDPTAWQGRLDVPAIAMGENNSTITVTAEHRMAAWMRPLPLLFNHADQIRIDPSDNFFLGIEALENADIVVFSKESMMR